MFLLIDNYDSFTYNLVQAFQVLGAQPTIVRNDNPVLLDLAVNPELAAVCISPGPGHPDQAGLCLEFLRRLPPRTPVLGVCLGHQVLGRFAGAGVDVGPHIVHGKASEISHDGQGMFAGLPSPLRVGRYHSLLVAEPQADGLFSVSARTAAGEPMALRYKDRPWHGLQFHPESVLTPDGLRVLGNFTALFSGPQQAGQAAEAVESKAPAAPPRLSAIMEDLAQGRDLTAEQARLVFSRLMDGELSPAQAGGFLMALRSKGETPAEMAEAVRAILDRAVPVPVPEYAPVLDVVGTGGDGRNSFNCSSGTALVLAALGHKVLKHGNRSVSSQCGSADVLEGLGLDLNYPVADIPRRLDEDGFVFLFAPRFHPSFKHIMPIRRELGVRTLFNLMGPLVNPARPGLCFLGVPRPDILPLLANTLAEMGNRNGAVVCGAGGYDELTAMGPAQVAFVRGREVTFKEINPFEFGFTPCRPEDLAVNGPQDGVKVLHELLNGRGPEPMRQMLALNTGFGLHLLHPERPLAACMLEGKNAVAQGLGGKFLEKLLARDQKTLPPEAAVA